MTGLHRLTWAGIAVLSLSGVGAAPATDWFAPGRFSYVINYGNGYEEAVYLGADLLHISGRTAYGGLSDQQTFTKEMAALTDIVGKAKAGGVRTVCGYVCATSVVGDPVTRTGLFGSFDRDWEWFMGYKPPVPIDEWLQQDINGKPLPSWYGGQYHPASMANPQWIDFESRLVNAHLKAGFDGMFFDNPSIHSSGDYSPEAMQVFRRQLLAEGENDPPADTAALRKLTTARPESWLRARVRIETEFFSEIRRRARQVNPAALIYTNYSLNSPQSLYDNPRTTGISIWDLSQVLDLVLIEDGATQARREPDGKVVEYAHMYHLIKPQCHGKPLVAVTSIPGTWNSDPALAPLSIAEAVANDATAVIAGHNFGPGDLERLGPPIRNTLAFYRERADELGAARPTVDVALFYHHLGWLKQQQTPAPEVALALTRRNIQYAVITEEDVAAGRWAGAQAIVVADPALLTPAQRNQLRKFGGPVIEAAAADAAATGAQQAVRLPGLRMNGPDTVRAQMRVGSNAAFVHLLNYDQVLLQSGQARLTPSGPVTLRIRVPAGAGRITATSQSPDRYGENALALQATRQGDVVRVTVPSVYSAELVKLSW